MFMPIHLLPQQDAEVRHRYRERWDIARTGPALRDKILQMIRDGAGEDFLQYEFERGALGFLEDDHDLKGLDILNEEITFPDGDTFEAIDLSYARFYHSTFTNAVFNCDFAFAEIYNCRFVNCIFAFNSFYGAILERVIFKACDFIEHSNFTNCDFKDVQFQGSCFAERFLFDCRFDENSGVDCLNPQPLRMKSGPLDRKEIAGIWGSIKEAFRAGGIGKRAREYYYQERHAGTRYNTRSKYEMVGGYVLELIAGYGVKPGRVIGVMSVVLGLMTVIFAGKVGFSEGLILAAGAFFTFGASSERLQMLGGFYRTLYILTAFMGVSITALLVTVLANVWFREQ